MVGWLMVKDDMCTYCTGSWQRADIYAVAVCNNSHTGGLIRAWAHDLSRSGNVCACVCSDMMLHMTSAVGRDTIPSACSHKAGLCIALSQSHAVGLPQQSWACMCGMKPSAFTQSEKRKQLLHYRGHQKSPCY